MTTPLDFAPVDPAYHRLALRWPSPRWWRPLLALVLSAVMYVLLTIMALIATLVTMVIAAVADNRDALAAFDAQMFETLDLYRPADFAISMATIILLLPAVLIGFRIAGCMPIGMLASVAGHVRWRWMLRCLAPAAAVLGVTMALEIGISAVVAGDAPTRVVPVASPLLFVLIIALVPLQAAAEEWVFRGAFMQVVGAWLRHPAWAILLPVPLFVLGHGYDLAGQLAVAAFAICAGWVTWRTGGLEAAIALHVVNNVVAMLISAFGYADLNASEVSWMATILSMVSCVVYVLWVDRICRSGRGPRMRGMTAAGQQPRAAEEPSILVVSTGSTGAVPGA